MRAHAMGSISTHSHVPQVPFVGRLASPVALFASGARALGPRRALVLAVIALAYAPAGPWALGAVRLWRASSLLGAQLLAPWLAKAMPADEAFALRMCAHMPACMCMHAS